jgi:hypothetical protein
MHAYEQQLASTIIDVLIEKLEKKGYRSRHLSRREVREHQLLRDIDNIEDSVEDAMLELYATGAWVEEKAFAINKNVQGGCAVNKTLNADLLVVLSFHSNTKTSGAIAKDIAQAMLIGSRHSQNNVEASYLKIAIIEAATNKIVWTHSITAIDGLFGMEKVEQKRFSKLFDMALKELPSV